MHWIIADLLMFACSVAVYLTVRKAALDKLSTQFNNLAMFAIPLFVFVIASMVTQPSFRLTLFQELKDDERFDKWFDHVNVKNLRYKDLIGVGRLVMAPAGTAPSLPLLSKKNRLEKLRLARQGKPRALPGEDDLLRDSEVF